MLTPEERAERKRECDRNYYASHKDRIRAQQQDYYAANADKVRESVRKYCAANPDKVRESQRKCRAKQDPEKIREYHRKYQAGRLDKHRESNRKYRTNNPEKEREARRKWRTENPEKVRELGRKYRSENPEVGRANASRRRASIKTSVSDAPTAKQISDLMKDPCLYCGEPSKHADHVIPLSRGGDHTIDNLVPSCAACNFSKGAKLPVIEWNGRFPRQDKSNAVKIS